MYFIIGFPKTRKQNESIMVMVDKVSKEAHLILVNSTYKAISFADIFMREIFILHEIPKIVIIDQDAKFTSNFWTSLFTGMDTKLNSIQHTILKRIVK